MRPSKYVTVKLIDEKELHEPYVDQKFNQARRSHQPVQIEENQFYVLGDNRDNSADSRIWGLVPKKNLLAKVLDK